MSLLSHFCRRIRLTGPISVGELMQDVIMDPKHGYYPQVKNRLDKKQKILFSLQHGYHGERSQISSNQMLESYF